MSEIIREESLLSLYRETVTAIVRQDGPDLTARQMAVLLAVYLQDDAQTVRGLAASIGVSKPAITRALDKLSGMKLARRAADPADRRSVLVERTSQGAEYLRGIAGAMQQFATAALPLAA